MIDIKFLRENPDAVKENIKKKFQDYKLPLVDQVIELDEQSRAVKKQADELRSNRNKISKQIGSLMAQGKKEEGMALKEEVTKQAEQLAELEKQEADLSAKVTEIMMQIPNIIDPSVPIGKDDSQNVEIEKFGDPFVPDFEIPNPFPEKERFVDIYRTLQGFDELSWTDILEYGDDRSKFRVPESVVDEMEKNFIDGFQEVLIAEAEKFSPFLERLVEAHFDSHFTLTTIDAFYYKVLNEMFDDNDMVDIKQTNIYQYEFTSEKFDLILSVPVFGVRDKADESSEFNC